MITKFDIGQQVWCVTADAVFTDTINWITIESDDIINYFFEGSDDGFLEDTLFADKIDAATYWLHLNGITIDSDLDIKATVTSVLKQMES